MVEHVVLTVAGGILGTLLGVALHRAIISRRVLALPASAASMGWPAFALLAALVVLICAAFAWITARTSAGQPAFAALLGSVRHTGSFRLLRARQVWWSAKSRWRSDYSLSAASCCKAPLDFRRWYQDFARTAC